MKVLSKEAKTFVTAKMRELEGVRCDKCGYVVPAKNGETQENKYYDVTTGLYSDHTARTHHDICTECVNEYIISYLDSAPIDAYIEVDPEFCKPEDIIVDESN